MSVGRYEMDDSLFYMIQEYVAKTDNLAGPHQKYVDIQCILDGAEIIVVQNANDLAHPNRDL